MGFSHFDFQNAEKIIKNQRSYFEEGKILESRGLVYKTKLERATLGALVEFKTENGGKCLGEVVSIDRDFCTVMPYEELTGINSLTRVKILPSKDPTQQNSTDHYFDFWIVNNTMSKISPDWRV